MQTLELVTAHARLGIQYFINEKETIALEDENEFLTEGLTMFQLHLASEIITYQAFLESRKLHGILNEWLEKQMDKDVKVDLNELSDYRVLKSLLLRTEEACELNTFELSMYSKILVYRQLLKDTDYTIDFYEFLNELTLDLSYTCGVDVGLLEYLINEELVETDEEINDDGELD